MRARHDGEAAVALVECRRRKQQRVDDMSLVCGLLVQILVVGDLGLGPGELQFDLQWWNLMSGPKVVTMSYCAAVEDDPRGMRSNVQGLG